MKEEIGLNEIIFAFRMGKPYLVSMMVNIPPVRCCICRSRFSLWMYDLDIIMCGNCLDVALKTKYPKAMEKAKEAEIIPFPIAAPTFYRNDRGDVMSAAGM